MSPVATVESLGAEGEGVVRDDGKVVFVPGALPGERIRYELLPGGRRFGRGVLAEVLEPLASRRASPCVHDRPGGCGGCSLLFAGAPAVAEAKARSFADSMRHAGIPGERLEAVRLAGSGLSYRNHAKFFVLPQGRLGYVARDDGTASGRRAKLAIERCPVLLPALDALRAAIDGRAQGATSVELRIGARTGEALVVVDAPEWPKGLDPVAIDASSALRVGERLVPRKGLPHYHELVRGVRFRVSAPSFFQVNTDGAELLATLVAEAAGPLDGKSLAVDVYAGVGLFTLASFAGAGRVVAVESAPSSVSDLRENAKGRRGLSIRPEDAVPALTDLVIAKERPDVIVADPPRAGLGPDVVRLLLALSPGRLVLVACEPRSLLRDLPPLLSNGYVIERLVPVDQFGGTHHLEVVAVLFRA